jgi:hypothetical protein
MADIRLPPLRLDRDCCRPWRSSSGLRPSGRPGDSLDAIAEWLVGPARHIASGAAFDEFAWRMLATGLPLLRVTLHNPRCIRDPQGTVATGRKATTRDLVSSPRSARNAGGERIRSPRRPPSEPSLPCLTNYRTATNIAEDPAADIRCGNSKPR